MHKKSLKQTNLYLKDPEKYRKALLINVASSTAIETHESTKAIFDRLIKEKLTI